MDNSDKGAQGYEWRQALKVGDKFAVKRSRYGQSSGYEILPVTRATKTQIVVDAGSYQRRFSVLDGHERGTDSDNVMMPITQTVLDHIEYRRLLAWLSRALQNSPGPTLEQLRAMRAAFESNKPQEDNKHG